MITYPEVSAISCILSMRITKPTIPIKNPMASNV
jgi:hypothetical protein